MTTTQELDRPKHALTVHEPYGFVACEHWAGTDLDIVNAARVSFGKRAVYEYDSPDRNTTEMQRLAPADAGLLNYLMKNRHGTPFEMAWCKFHISAPIFVFREWHRHRIASINEMSARYVELAPRFYLPDDEHVRVQEGKPGHYIYVAKGTEERPNRDFIPGPVTYGDYVRAGLQEAYQLSYSQYQLMMNVGVAKEISRACLPVAIYSEQYWACNVRALLNFLSLRNHPRALQEIRDYAAVMEGIFENQMPAVHAAFVANDRIAP